MLYIRRHYVARRNAIKLQILRRRGRAAIAVLSALALFVLVAAANKIYVSASTGNAVFSQKTWSGGSGSEDTWTVNANWAGIGGAGPGDDLVFPENAARKTNSNDFP